MKGFSVRKIHPTLGKPDRSLAVVAARIAFGAALVALVWWWASTHRSRASAEILVLLVAVGVGIWLSPTLVDLPGAYIRWVRYRQLSTWQGRYYAFENRQIRIDWLEDRVWIALDDAAAAARLDLNSAEVAKIAPFDRREHAEFQTWVVSEEALLALLDRRTHAQALKFRVWLTRDVLPPFYKRAARAELEAQQNPPEA